MRNQLFHQQDAPRRNTLLFATWEKLSSDLHRATPFFFNLSRFLRVDPIVRRSLSGINKIICLLVFVSEDRVTDRKVGRISISGLFWFRTFIPS